MFQIRHRVIRRNDDAEEIGTVIGVIPDNHNSTEHTLYDVEFASGLRKLHGFELRTTWDRLSSCTEKDQLSLTFKKASTIWYQAVTASGNAAGLVARTEFELLSRRVEDAQKVCQLARELLQQHTVEHGC